jgi:hypothetical protein
MEPTTAERRSAEAVNHQGHFVATLERKVVSYRFKKFVDDGGGRSNAR